jgi:hypothetical protein
LFPPPPFRIALADKACQDGFSAHYCRLPRLTFELALAQADGSYLKLLGTLAKANLLILDIGSDMDAYSGPIRPLIPFQIGHPFRFIPATCSG